MYVRHFRGTLQFNVGLLCRGKWKIVQPRLQSFKTETPKRFYPQDFCRTIRCLKLAQGPDVVDFCLLHYLFSLVHLRCAHLRCSVLNPWKHKQRRSVLKSKYSEKEFSEPLTWVQPMTTTGRTLQPLSYGRKVWVRLPSKARRRYFFLSISSWERFSVQFTLYPSHLKCVPSYNVKTRGGEHFEVCGERIQDTNVYSAVQYGYNFGFIGKETYSWAIIYFLYNMFPTLSLWVKNLKCR